MLNGLRTWAQRTLQPVNVRKGIASLRLNLRANKSTLAEVAAAKPKSSAAKSAMKLGVTVSATLSAYQMIRLYGDEIKADNNLTRYLEKQRRENGMLFELPNRKTTGIWNGRWAKPWISEDKELLAYMRREYPNVNLYEPQQLEAPNSTPIQVVEMKSGEINAKWIEAKVDMLTIGGFAALATADEALREGMATMHLSDRLASSAPDKVQLPIEESSARHPEHQRAIEAPAWQNKKNRPYRFIAKQFFGMVFLQPRYNREVSAHEYPFLHMTPGEWARALIMDPKTVREAAQVAMDTEALATQYDQDKAAGKPTVSDSLREDLARSKKQMWKLNSELDDALLHGRNACVTVASGENEVASLHALQADIKSDGIAFDLFSKEDLPQKFGMPLNGDAFGIKADPCFAVDAQQQIERSLKQRGAAINTNARITTIYKVDGVAKYAKYLDANNLAHIVEFKQCYLSTGITPVLVDGVNTYPQISVSATSGKRLLVQKAAEVKAGEQPYHLNGEIVMGDSSIHITPLGPTKLRLYKGELCYTTPIVQTGGAYMNPNVRGPHHYDFPIDMALRSKQKLEGVLPKGVRVEYATQIGCNRKVGKHGCPTNIELATNLNWAGSLGGSGITLGTLFAANMAEKHQAKLTAQNADLIAQATRMTFGHD